MRDESRPEQLVEPDEIKAYYMSEDVVATYEDIRFSGIDYLKQANERQAVLWALAQDCSGHVLEVASGTGRLGRAAAAAGHMVACLDYSLPMLAHSRQEASRASDRPVGWVRADAFHLPFSDHSIDAVICYRFLRHFEEADRLALWGEIARVLRSGGALILDVPNIALHVDRSQRFIYDQAYTLASFEQEAATSGFCVARVFGNGYTFLSRRPLRSLWRLRALVVARAWIETRLLSRLGFVRNKAYLWSVVCQRL